MNGKPPFGHCQDCGERLVIELCLNCNDVRIEKVDGPGDTDD